MHTLAYIYHWSRQDVWLCPVKERNMWVKKVMNQLNSEREQIENNSTTSEDSQISYNYSEGC